MPGRPRPSSPVPKGRGRLTLTDENRLERAAFFGIRGDAMMHDTHHARRPWHRTADILLIALTAALLLWAGAVQITAMFVH